MGCWCLLAGSEGLRASEAMSVNLSLTCLGKVLDICRFFCGILHLHLHYIIIMLRSVVVLILITFYYNGKDQASV